MRIANLAGRLVLLTAEDLALDVQRASAGRFASEPQSIYERWEEFHEWAERAIPTDAVRYATADLRSPAPTPRQVFAIARNYDDSPSPRRTAIGSTPLFTKFPSAISGPYDDVQIPTGGHTDWEVELVVVLGREARRIGRSDAWSHVAGLSVGQDLSERLTQLGSPEAPPQFSLAKSFPGFGPIGPWLVTLEEFDDPDDLVLCCSVNGEEVQRGRTRHLAIAVPDLLASLSQSVTLLPGDVVFTGTPGGSGMTRQPPRWLAAGDELVSQVEGIGLIRQRIVARAP